MVDIRQATALDIPLIKACDLLCFPEEDPWDYSLYKDFIDFWPRLVFVAQDHGGTGCIVGFVFAHMEGEGTKRHGYIANLGVHPAHRKLGIAKKLMKAVQDALVQEYRPEYVCLHVRISNQAAINLYIEKLGYNCEIEAKFYDDGGDAYVMRKQLPEEQPDLLMAVDSCDGYW
ncbi:hypothetical protein MKW94_002466 [Papaver nudicaule]|uniref:N-acetyltransferase domain-containing protein n=1 Tax=Papaver nudicaule TaxID=74823 RepID=A0AA41VKM3_PAPNU|nr:hypothetical protein [Papaver nudicaule]